MSEEKIKAGDLARELGIKAEELAEVGRRLDIQVRKSVSLTGNEAGRLRAEVQKNGVGSVGTERRGSGVIVRRRQSVSKAAEGNGTVEAEDVSAKSSETEATAEESKPDKAQAAKNTARKRARRAPMEIAPARIISRPEDIAAAKAAEEARLAEEKRLAEEAARLAEEARKAEEAAAAREEARKAEEAKKHERSTPVFSASPEEAAIVRSGSAREDGAERRRSRKEAAVPHVRVISRPSPQTQTVSQTPQATAGENPRENRFRDGGGTGKDFRERRDFNNRRGEGADSGRMNRGEGRSRSEGNRDASRSSGRSFQGSGRGEGRDGFDRDAESSRPSRPQRSAGGGSRQPAGIPAALAGEGQSKKKRNKNVRRNTDFEDFGGRRREDDEEMPRMRSVKRRPKASAHAASPVTTQPIKAAKRKIRVEEAIRVNDMAHQMGLKAGEIIKVLFNLGIIATINKSLDFDTAAVVASEFGYEVEHVGFMEEEYLANAVPDKPEQLRLRPPVVTIMGHVDHGKTSLLDAIRKTNVTSGEAGGITQHIGAYHVTTKRGEIVFLDTPGHEAFTAMRARGAQMTDLVVLVVAADDGVMEQTREAVNHSRAAGVPILVAVNKMDKPTANPDRVLRELAEIGLVPEEWGGDTIVAKVSAKTREGLDDLLELLALQAEILELKANPDKLARGHIVEAKLDKGRGPVATVLIQEGTLHQGDNFVCGVFSGRVRAMFNDQGRKTREAGPSIPVEVQGFDGVPEAGEEFICLSDEKLARRIAESRAIKQRERELAKATRVTLETFLASGADDEEAKALNLVVKADVQGSLEAILEALRKLSTDKVQINIIHGGTGAITESDILLASASDAIVIGFNVRPASKVRDLAEHESIDIRFYDIIYKLVDEIKSAMAGLLAPVSREQALGQAEVRKVISVPKVGAIAGSLVTDGKITRTAGARLVRDGVVVYTGKIASLRRFKDDVREVLKGYECGICLENFNDIKDGDVIEAFEVIEEAATL
ncbi:MAG: translation initiation factor IF-2 [Desulfovibrionaceae bacterium]|nr:translation initiation factor IF-2 [Desulfovibrionaceae bacterium]